MQGVCPPEEWEAFLEALRKPLPTTFRINGSGKFADDLRAKLESDFLSQFNAGPIRVGADVCQHWGRWFSFRLVFFLGPSPPSPNTPVCGG